MTKSVKVYSTPTCPWCAKTKEFLKKKKVKFEEVNVAEDEKGRDLMIEKSGQMGVPVIVIEQEDGTEEVIVGFDEGKLKLALGL